MLDSPARPRVLVVDPGPGTAQLVRAAVDHPRFEVAHARSAGEALRVVERFGPDVVVLDVDLPDGDGLAALPRLRAGRPDLPALLVDGRRRPGDVLRGLAAGADDYLVAPVHGAELLARVRAVLRRCRPRTPGPVVRVADLTFEAASGTVRRGDAVLDLTVTEHRLLGYLAAHPDVVLPRTRILADVWRHDPDCGAAVLDTYVSYLRRKLEAHGPRLVHTVRGVGYVLRT